MMLSNSLFEYLFNPFELFELILGDESLVEFEQLNKSSFNWVDFLILFSSFESKTKALLKKFDFLSL